MLCTSLLLAYMVLKGVIAGVAVPLPLPLLPLPLLLLLLLLLVLLVCDCATEGLLHCTGSPDCCGSTTSSRVIAVPNLSRSCSSSYSCSSLCSCDGGKQPAVAVAPPVRASDVLYCRLGDGSGDMSGLIIGENTANWCSGLWSKALALVMK
jgi:hypothetical protein